MIIKPVLTEKSARNIERSVYTFIVDRVSKGTIRKEIEKQFSVKVLSVRIVNLPEKNRRLKYVPRRKKAYVQLKPGFKIPIIEEVIHAK